MSGAAEPEVACVAIPAFPLQVVLRAHPDWRDDPVVIVEDDRPQARIRWANRTARRHRIGAGQRFSEAQSLVARLHAVPESDVGDGAVAEEILDLLLSFSPRVEPAGSPAGVFWMDPRGLARLYRSRAAWAERVHRRLAARGLAGSVVLGWQRACLLAIAASGTGVRLPASAEEERRLAGGVALACLDLPARLLEELRALDVTTLEEFRKLPASGLAARFGPEARALHDFARGRSWTPLRPAVRTVPYRTEVGVEPPDDDRHRLLFAVKGALHELLHRVRRESRGVLTVELRLELEHAPAHLERIDTASPTLDAGRLADLVRLRLGIVTLDAPVERIVVEVRAQPVAPGQLELLQAAPTRDLARASAAVARVKAAFGGGSVARARLADAYLPEARVRWEPVREVTAPRPPTDTGGPLPLVRTLLPAPLPLPDLPRHEREAWLGRHGAVRAMHGPDRLGSGWWATPCERDYFLVETDRGGILWLFQDRAQHGWHLHGVLD